MHTNISKQGLFVFSGLIFIIFSLSFLSLRVEKKWTHVLKIEKKHLQTKLEISHSQGTMNNTRQRIDELNSEVNQVAEQISILIFDANEINDTIVQFMNHSLANMETLDSLKLMDETIARKEQLIDSLSLVFKNQSENLLSLMNKFNKKELELDMQQNDGLALQKELWWSKLIVFIYLFFSVLGLLIGSFLLIRGLKCNTGFEKHSV